MTTRTARSRQLFELIWTVLSPYRFQIIFGLLALTVNRACALFLPGSTRAVVDQVLIRRRVDMLPHILRTLCVATLLQAASSLYLVQVFSKGGHKLIAVLRLRLFEHVLDLKMDFFRSHRGGELISRILADVEGIRFFLGAGMIDFVGGTITALFSFVLLARISPRLTLSVAIPIVLFVIVLTLLLARVHPVYRNRSRAIASLSGRLAESMAGISTIKGFTAEKHESSVTQTGVARVRDLNRHIVSLEAWMSLASVLVSAIVGIWVIVEGCIMVPAGEMTLGSYLTFSLFLAYLISPVSLSVNLGTQLSEALAGLTRASDLLREHRESDDADRSTDVREMTGEIRFENVSFSYSQNHPVLHNVTFTAHSNSVLALVGSSGSGKTTIANLICGFDSPNSGSVFVDGIDLRTVRLSGYRRMLGVVFQDTFLFHGSLFDNVAFARPGASQHAVLDACRISRVDEFAETFREGYDTIVGERGIKLSGGQRQRIAIARAILANPKILILDEATASLDSESEQFIQQSLSFLMRDRTTIVIAHRLSTIRKADLIIVLENGKIVERGDHESLYQEGTRYKALWDYQTSHEVDACVPAQPSVING